MARKAKKTPDEKTAYKNKFDPVGISFRVFSLFGRPVYLILSRIFIGIILVLNAIGFIISLIFEKLIPGLLKAYRKRIKKISKKAKKIKFPKVRLPVLAKYFRLERLRLTLFELSLASKIRELFSKKVSRTKKLRLRKRILLLIFIIVIFSGSLAIYFPIIKPLPNPEELAKKVPEVSTKIYDRNGTLLYKIYKDQNRSIIPLSQIPLHVRLATLAAEDAEFYENPGFSIKGMARALIKDIQTGSMHGGSTITQQLVKNVLLTPEKTIIRKIREIILSVEVETHYTKDQILEMYLNQINYGGTAYGIEEASQEFFGKGAQDLDLGEAAYLAGLTKSPTTLSPYGQNPEYGISRQREVLHLMTINKFITPEQERKASEEVLTFIPNKNHILAPHFVMFVRQLLVNKYGEDVVEKGGLEVTTSIDLPIQNMAQQIVASEIEKLKNLNVGNGSALVVNPKTGEILTMVGSTDYFNNKNGGQVNVTTRLRQPGSSIKVVNYAYALSHNYTPATSIDDTPITYVTPGSPPYSPVNYDGKFIGPISLRSALAQSRNIPAVKVLASYGVDKMVKQGQDMGIESWSDPSKFGLSLTLGGGAVTSLDMARVFSTLANYGQTPEILPILIVKDYKGHILENNSPKLKETLDPRVSFMLTDILKDNNARAPEFGLNSYLVIPNHPEVAVKTGTSNDLRDNWTDGYSQNYLVITWVGNNDNSPMSRIASGVTGASPIWNKIMSTLLKDSESVDWSIPEGLVKVNCPGGKSEWFMSDNKVPYFCKPSPTPHPDNKKDKILEGAASENR